MTRIPLRRRRTRLIVGLGGVYLIVACSAAPGQPGTTTPGTVRPSSAGTSAPAVRYPVGVTRYARSARSRLPALSGRTLDGRQLAVSQWRGHVVVLNVWASWCEPCTAESPALVHVARSTTASGVRFVGVDERDEPAAASDFLRSIRSPYPHLVDDGHLLAAVGRWLPQAVPGSLVIDRSGRVAARVVGPVTADRMASLVAAVLAER